MRPLWPSFYKPFHVPASEVIEEACQRFKIGKDDLLGRKKRPVFVLARAVVAVRLRKRGLTYPVIGRMLGGRDHSTIMNLVERFPVLMERAGDR